MHAESEGTLQRPHIFTMPMPTRRPLPFPLAGLRVASLFALLLFAGCEGQRGDYDRFDVPPSGEPIGVTESWRTVLDHDPLPAPDSADAAWAPLVSDILQLGPWPTERPFDRAPLDSAWSAFTAFEGTRAGVRGIDSVLAETRTLNRASDRLRDAFGRWPALFPGQSAPDLDFAYTGFNYSVYPTDELLLIGCEFFLGAQHPAVLGLPPTLYPRYMQERMVPDHLVGDALRGWLLVHFQDTHYDRNGRLAEELLYWGKVLYIARCLSPEMEPHHLMDWTQSEWEWAEANERAIWSELRQEDILYTRRRMDIQRWTADAPFTKAGAVPQESPDRLGWFMGLRWVEDLMARQTDLDLPGLMAEQEVLPFLQAYRPGS